MFGRIKSYLIGVLFLALPIIYILGTVLGRKAAQTDRVIDANKSANDAAEFYKRMAEYEADVSITNRSDLIERLRKDGL
jgi:lipopolysaccharide biosynthesis regulator YciM